MHCAYHKENSQGESDMCHILGLETVVSASPSPHANLNKSLVQPFITPETDADGLGAPDVSFYPQAINHGNALCNPAFHALNIYIYFAFNINTNKKLLQPSHKF